MNQRFKLIVLTALALTILTAGCGPKGTITGYSDTLDTWKGGNINAMIAVWGPPQHVDKNSSGQISIWEKKDGCQTIVASDAIGRVLGAKFKGDKCLGLAPPQNPLTNPKKPNAVPIKTNSPQTKPSGGTKL